MDETKNIYSTTVNDYIKCWFDGNYKVLGLTATKKDFEDIKTAYIDNAGLFSSSDFDLVCQIFNLETRLSIVANFITAQRGYINTLNVPCIEFLNLLKPYGHKVIWDGNKEKFIARLFQIEMNEKSIQGQLSVKEKQLSNSREKIVVGKELTTSQIRAQFIKLLIVLGKSDYKINRDETTMYDLSLMVKMQREEYNAIVSQSKQKTD